MSETFFVRHGAYTSYPEQRLTADGRLQAEQAALILYARNATETSVILSSDEPRALQTAEIIQQQLECNDPIPSSMINLGFNEPRAVKSVQQLIDFALRQASVELGDRQLIVVGHQPLLNELKGSRVRHGEVVTLQQDLATWMNPHYNHREGVMYLPELYTDV